MKNFIFIFILTLTFALNAQVGMDQYMQMCFPMTQTYEKALEICKEKEFSHFLIKKVCYRDEQGQTLTFKGISHVEGSVLVSETITRKFDPPVGTLHLDFELLCFKKAPRDSLAINVQEVFNLISAANSQQLGGEAKDCKVREIKNIEELKIEVAEGRKPIYLECYSTNCSPCKIITSIFDKISKDFSSCGIFLRGNLDNISELSSEYKIEAIPTLIVFEGQKEVVRKSSLPQILEYFQNFGTPSLQPLDTDVVTNSK